MSVIRLSTTVLLVAFLDPLLAEDASLEIVGCPPAFEGRVVQWRTDSGSIGCVQPLTFAVADSPGGGSLAMGFTHAGYTATDPDGKVAFLTMTLRPKTVPLTSKESTTLKNLGVRISPDVSVKAPVWTHIDLMLPASPVEQKRLQSTFGFPRKLGTLSANQPVTLKWKGVDGGTLFSWLTDPDTGLRFVLSNPRELAAVRLRRRASYVLLKPATVQWWDEVATDARRLSWAGGSQALASTLVDANTVSGGGSQPGWVLESMSTRIESASSDLGGRRLITKEALLGLAGRVDSEFGVSASIPLTPGLLAGQPFLSAPGHVKDLSGAGVGLEAIKKDGGRD